MSNNFKYTENRYTLVTEILCVKCLTSNTATKAIESQQSLAEAVEGEREVFVLQPLPETLSSNPTILLEALGHCRWSLQKEASNSTDHALEADFTSLRTVEL